ncbi:hypothetical protein [Streptacidiphilus neutrinimicus]|nr:hypothetical protein [Streptacidiphilus neutrinimicus]
MLRQAAGDNTDADVATTTRVLGRMLALFDDVDLGRSEPPR